MLLFSFAVHADPDKDPPKSSLFFKPQDVRIAENLAQANAPPGSADIRLGSVFFYGKNDWTLWLQNEKWTPTTAHDNLLVTDVSPEQVDIAWRDDNGTERKITL